MATKRQRLAARRRAVGFTRKRLAEWVVGDVADLVVQTRSARLVKELRTTRARMPPWQDTHAVKELDDRLVTYGLKRSDAS